jgi:glucose/mannose-6-phosphate isomerase
MAAGDPIPVLDDIERVNTVDKRNMLRLINDLPEQFETSLGIARSFALKPAIESPDVVLIIGVGDSAVAGDMASAIVASEIGVPFVSIRDGTLPAYVGAKSLVIVVDYVGRNVVTLSNYKSALARGACVVCVTSGGKLLEAATQDGISIVKIPPGQPSRTAIGYQLAPLLFILEQCGLVSGTSEGMSRAVKLMKSAREALRFENPTKRNLAKKAATELASRPIAVCATEGYRGVLADRWKSQIAANSKMPAMALRFPDAAEADVCGWETEKCGSFGFVLLTDSDDRSVSAEQMLAFADIVCDCKRVVVELQGGSVIEKMLYGVYFGDYFSYYLALLRGVNPSANQIPDEIEARVSECSTV